MSGKGRITAQLHFELLYALEIAQFLMPAQIVPLQQSVQFISKAHSIFI